MKTLHGEDLGADEDVAWLTTFSGPKTNTSLKMSANEEEERDEHHDDRVIITNLIEDFEKLGTSAKEDAAKEDAAEKDAAEKRG